MPVPEVTSDVKSEVPQSTEYQVEITEHVVRKDVPVTTYEKTDDKTQQDSEEAKQTQEGELTSSEVKSQQAPDEPDALFSF